MSSLQKQLAAIAATSTHQLDLKAQKAAHAKSLLFEPKVAANQSFDYLYELCYEGFRDLCALDARFVPFAKTIFSEQSKSEDRTQMTKKENKTLSSVLESFLTLVGPRLLLKPAEKALEWLVRRFRVHEYNTECLILTYLPYFATRQFLSLLSVLPASPPQTFRFLHPYISPPSNPPRKVIVYTAINQDAFFTALQNYVVKVIQAGHQGSQLLSFWSGITTQAVDGALEAASSGRREVQNQQTEKLLLRVLTPLNELFQLAHISDVAMGCYMITIVLVSKGSFEDKILNTLMEAVAGSQQPETLDSCLMCLAVIAEERSAVALPPKVARRLLRIPDLLIQLQPLAKRLRIERLTLGCALAALESAGSPANHGCYERLLESKILNEPQTTLALSVLLRLLKTSTPGSDDHARLLDLASRLNDSTHVSPTLHSLLHRNVADFKAVGLELQALPNTNASDSEDVDMLDINENTGVVTEDVPAIEVPDITTPSFLKQADTSSWRTVLDSFEKTRGSLQAVSKFLSAPSLHQDDAFENPLFFTFLIRVWCGTYSIPVRNAALRAATALLRNSNIESNLQLLIPYLVHALADPSLTIRRSASACTAALVTTSQSLKQSDGIAKNILGSKAVYGKNTNGLYFLAMHDTQALLSSVLSPILEECTMDPSFVVSSIHHVLAGASESKRHSDVKAAQRVAFANFFAAHVERTPILRVRLSLFPLFNSTAKTIQTTRTKTLLHTLHEWAHTTDAEASSLCQQENLAITEADQKHLAMLLPRESASADLLKDIITGNGMKQIRESMLNAAFDRLIQIWHQLRSEFRWQLSTSLLDLALTEEGNDKTESLRRTRSLETLRTVQLDTNALVAFIESIPSTTRMADGPPSSKRRRTSRSEMARVDLQSSGDVATILRRLTLVLELIEGSTPEKHVDLFKHLFAILGEVQQLKQQSGSSLAYLQSLIFGSLLPIINKLKQTEDPTEYRTSVRADLLIDCIRHSTSPQVQNQALLLIGALASWVPELVLHNLMPVFTFIGSTLVRQRDDYSSHVVDQTIARVVPQLAASLRARNKSFLTGVADLLLSFTAAFEHVPQHRRLKLFYQLAKELGPEESLPAIVALLADRYPTSLSQRTFVAELLRQFAPIVSLKTIKGYLDLVVDAASSKRTISDNFFNLNEKQPGQVEQTLATLLTCLSDLLNDSSLRSRIGAVFKSGATAEEAHAIFADVMETTIRISKQVAESSQLYRDCSVVLSNCLSILPTADLVRSAELLLENKDNSVQTAAVKAVEVRASNVAQADSTSVTSLLGFLPRVEQLLQHSKTVDVRIVSVSCLDRIVERFGKKDTAAVVAIAQTIVGPQALANSDNRVRVISLMGLASVVDVIQDAAISLLPMIIPKAFEYLKHAIDKDEEQLHDAAYTFLSVVIESIGFIFSGEYLDQALKLSHSSASAQLADECDDSRRQFFQVVATKLGAGDVFGSLKRTWDHGVGAGVRALQEHLEILHLTVSNKTKSEIVKSSSALFALLLQAFDVRSSVQEAEGEDDDDNEEMERLENSLTETVIDMTLKLNDATFRPFFVQLVESMSPTSVSKFSRSITFYRALAAFFDKFKSIVTTYASYITEHAAQTLTLVNAEASLSDDQRNTLRKAVLDALQRSFEHDQDGFWQSPSHFGTILSPLLSQLTISDQEVVTESVVPTITELAAASSSSIDNHRELNTILLRYLRDETASTRLNTVKCEQALTKRLGEEWMGLLPEMLPFISELREDDDEMVERETTRWIGSMEEILGESLDDMLQ